jgi:hypothetical protein
VIWQIGKEVKTELGRDGQPRWRWDNATGKPIDGGYTDKWIRGFVASVTSHTVVELIFTDKKTGTFSWGIPLDVHPWYRKDQWTWPGFVNLIEEEKPDPICCCGSWSTYGKGKGPQTFYCDVK